MHTPDGPRIIMDSPPHLEPCEPFIEIGQKLVSSGIQVPKIYFQDPEQGFLVLSDFGDRHFQDILHTQERNERYADAIQQIIKLQVASQSWFAELPLFDVIGRQKNWKFSVNGAYPILRRRNLQVTLLL